MPPVKFKASDMPFIDDIFESGSGWVLDFSNRTFADFFEDELDINIDDPRWYGGGDSKGKRLRYFLRNSEPQIVIRTLQALWDYREKNRKRNRIEETIPDAEDDFYELMERLGGKRPSGKTPAVETTAQIDSGLSGALKQSLIDVSLLEPIPRGFAFERFLKSLFDANGLAARASFRLVGEQIDGSFELSRETYLLEAKWQNNQVGSADLRSFNGKVEDKAAWSRGLFVSNSGFSKDGLRSFGRGKRVVCMDGLDLYEMLDKNLSFADVLAKKVRHAAETGNPFVQVRDLYP